MTSLDLIRQLKLCSGRIHVCFLFFVFLLFAFQIGTIQDAYAQRTVTHEKVLDVKKEALEILLRDVENLSQLFSGNANSFAVKEASDEKNFHVSADIFPGCTISTDLEHMTQGKVHVVNFLSGSLEGSTLSIKLKETWGFDGTPNGGTAVKMNFAIRDIPCILDFLVGDDVIVLAMDKGLMDLENKAKEIETKLKESIVTDLPIDSEYNEAKSFSHEVDSNQEQIVIYNLPEHASAVDEREVTIPKEPDNKSSLSNHDNANNTVQTTTYDNIMHENSEYYYNEAKNENATSQKQTSFSPSAPPSTDDVSNANNEYHKLKNEDSDVTNVAPPMLRINDDEYIVKKHESKWLEISGMIPDSVRGEKVNLVLTMPDGATQTQKTILTKDGYYETKLIISQQYEEGTYVLDAIYGGKTDSVSFKIRN